MPHIRSGSAFPAAVIPRASWWIRALGAAGCLALLAGCAGNPANSSRADRHGYGNSSAYDNDWVKSDDPIGALVSQRLGRESTQSRRAAALSRGNPLVGEALNQLGVRYRFGGNTPDTGFDCSGLVRYSAERSLGVQLPRNAAAIAGTGMAISRDDLRPGDLVFFNTMGRRNSHVGIYMGDDRFVHSPSAGGVVRIEDMTMAYWTKRYNGARRITNTDVASAQLGD